MRTNYRLTGGPASTDIPGATGLVFTGVLAQGSFSDSCTASGYLSVAHGLEGTPRSAYGIVVSTSAVLNRSNLNLVAIDSHYITFLLQTGASADLTTVTLVWNAFL